MNIKSKRWDLYREVGVWKQQYLNLNKNGHWSSKLIQAYDWLKNDIVR
jgi:hypothetical protein